MLTPFSLLLTLHVMAAILGLGPIVAVAVVAGLSAREERPSAQAVALVQRLLTWTSAGLGVMLATGIAIEVVAGGAWHATWWFRGSFVLLIVVGVLCGRARVSLRKAQDALTLQLVGRLSTGACAVVALVAALMVLKPG